MPQQTHDERYQKALCDPDAGVMVSALPIYLKLTKVFTLVMISALPINLKQTKVFTLFDRLLDV